MLLVALVLRRLVVLKASFLKFLDLMRMRNLYLHQCPRPHFVSSASGSHQQVYPRAEALLLSHHYLHFRLLPDHCYSSVYSSHRVLKGQGLPALSTFLVQLERRRLRVLQSFHSLSLQSVPTGHW